MSLVDPPPDRPKPIDVSEAVRIVRVLNDVPNLIEGVRKLIEGYNGDVSNSGYLDWFRWSLIEQAVCVGGKYRDVALDYLRPEWDQMSPRDIALLANPAGHEYDLFREYLSSQTPIRKKMIEEEAREIYDKGTLEKKAGYAACA